MTHNQPTKPDPFTDPRSITNDPRAQEIIGDLQAQLMGYHYAEGWLRATHPELVDDWEENRNK